MPQYTELPVLPSRSFFSQQGLNYGLKSYLSLSNQYATIDRSVTFENRSYHLISLHNSQSQSYLLTAIKIVSYFTVILPVLAMIIVSITDGKNHYYDSTSYIDDFKDMLYRKPQEAKIISLLDPLVLYKKTNSGKSTLVEIFTNGFNSERKAISQLIKNDPGSALTKEDKKELFDTPIYLDHGKLDIIKALNIATQGALHKDLTKNDLNKMLKNNRELWTYLTSKTNPFRVNPKLAEVDLEYFYHKLEYPTTYKNELADLYNADPSVLTREDSNGRTMFMRLLKDNRYVLEESVNWIIKTDLKSILTKKNVDALFKHVSTARVSPEFRNALKNLNVSTKGAIHKDFSKKDLNLILKHDHAVWAYLISKTNPFPVNPLSVEVDLDYFYYKLQDPMIYKNELADLYNADPSVLTREDSNGRTMFMKLLENYSYSIKEPVDWIIKTNLNSILTQKNTAALFKDLSESYVPSELLDSLKTLNVATKGALHKDLTKECVDKIYKENREVWDYLTNADGTNPYPIDPKLRTPPTHSSSDDADDFFSWSWFGSRFGSSSRSSSSSSSSSSGRSSGSRRSPPPTASSGTPTADPYQDGINTMHTLAGIALKDWKEPTTQRAWKQLYNKAALKTHPDKHPNEKDAYDLKFKEFQQLWQKIQSLQKYKDLAP